MVDRPVTAETPGFGDELASSIIHGVGIALSIAGLAILVAMAARHGDAPGVAACAVFGSTLVLLYTASTLYHSISVAAARPVSRVLDHMAIYLLIAGTYTPFTLIALPPCWAVRAGRERAAFSCRAASRAPGAPV